MKCHEFEDNVGEVLRGEIGEAKRKDALAHALGCARCGALLETERRLSVELHALAASQAGEQAPGRLEQQLLEAFRSYAASRAGSTPTPRELARPGELRIADCGLRISGRPVSAREASFGTSWWIWGVAAASLLLCAFVLNGLLRKPAAPAGQPARTTPRQQSTGPQNASAAVPAPAQQAAPVAPPNQRAAAAPARKTARRQARQAAPEPAETEVATDFFVVPYSEPLRPEESKRIMRVNVPRMTLAAFGVPVNPERAMDPIQADVLVGEDNLARAMRFVGTFRPVTPARPAPALRPVNANYVR